jgi:hypothetical protein
MDDYSYAVVQKCGLLLLPFVERSRDLVIKNLLITDDKSRFIRIIKRLCKLPCLRQPSQINSKDFYCLLKLLRNDFNNVRLKIIIRAYSLYIDQKYISHNNI